MVCATPLTCTTESVSAHGGEVHAFGRLLDQLVEQVHRHVAVELQVFYRRLARLQALDVVLKGGDVLDLRLELADLDAQEVVARLLLLRELLQRDHPHPGTHGTGHRGQTQFEV
ncbi:hypothetical protein PEC18_29820 [Paucibacter sp. O1-1]|nr:hypothetical protein [Paucibacter sp. O1-1]MDA3829931.1 hypothetical protein [Paucibacter sp. O1-1]